MSSFIWDSFIALWLLWAGDVQSSLDARDLRDGKHIDGGRRKFSPCSFGLSDIGLEIDQCE